MTLHPRRLSVSSIVGSVHDMSSISDFAATVTVPTYRSDILDTLLDATYLPD